jgi:hypothetical protein
VEYCEALERLAPCGLDCSRCADCAGGEIQSLSGRLVRLLSGYARVARVKQEKRPVFAGYSQCEEVLNTFAQAACSGCRGDNCLCPIDCVVRPCTRERGLDFCFQCGDFPCAKDVNAQIRERWLTFNRRMKEIGAAAFCEEQAQRPRY